MPPFARHIAALSARHSALVEVWASALSVLALFAVTGVVLVDAVGRLREPVAEDVDPTIMFCFTFVNLLVDFAMCGSIVLRRTGGLAGCLAARCACAVVRRDILK